MKTYKLNPQGHKSLIPHAFADRFGVSWKAVKLIGSSQLCECKSDEARRILLGVSEQIEEAAE